jgi:hypothetical protein
MGEVYTLLECRDAENVCRENRRLSDMTGFCHEIPKINWMRFTSANGRRVPAVTTMLLIRIKARMSAKGH